MSFCSNFIYILSISAVILSIFSLVFSNASFASKDKDFLLFINFINGVELCPVICLSIFSLVKNLFAVFTASHKLSIENKTQYNLFDTMFLNTSNTCGSSYPNNLATCFILITYASGVSTFSS